jgi:murein L,D-transpeptidase YcbB/YkuD
MRLGNKLPTEGTSQAAGDQLPTIAQTTTQITHMSQTLHPQPSTNPHAADADSTEQPIAQTEVLAMNTSAPNPPSHQHQTREIQEDLQQDSEEEIKAIIEDELTRFCQKNERLHLMQEHLARQWQKDLKSCHSRLSRKEQPKQSCSEQ